MAELPLEDHFLKVFDDAARFGLGGVATQSGLLALSRDPLFRAAMADVLVREGHVSYVPLQPIVCNPMQRYLSLGELIERLEKENPDKVIALGFKEPHSYRGDYTELAFEPEINARVGDMASCARSALGATFPGYKGGEYTMNKHSDVWIAFEGQDSDNKLGPMLLEMMLAQVVWPLPEVPAHNFVESNRHGGHCHYGGCSLMDADHPNWAPEEDRETKIKMPTVSPVAVDNLKKALDDLNLKITKGILKVTPADSTGDVAHTDLTGDADLPTFGWSTTGHDGDHSDDLL